MASSRVLLSLLASVIVATVIVYLNVPEVRIARELADTHRSTSEVSADELVVERGSDEVPDLLADEVMEAAEEAKTESVTGVEETPSRPVNRERQDAREREIPEIVSDEVCQFVTPSDSDCDDTNTTQSVSRLQEKLEKSVGRAEQIAIVRELSSLRSDDAVDALISLVDHPDSEIRFEAVEALWRSIQYSDRELVVSVISQAVGDPATKVSNLSVAVLQDIYAQPVIDQTAGRDAASSP